MFDYLGWGEVADSIYTGMERTIQSKKVTYDFHRLMDNATLLKTSEFADTIISNIY
jgi:isocitrate dehydrogenase